MLQDSESGESFTNELAFRLAETVEGLGHVVVADAEEAEAAFDTFDDGEEDFIWLTPDKGRAKATLHIEDLADEVADLHDRLETRKLIDRAKGILMKALNLSEPEAFSWIQRAAMDRRLSMKDVAEAVINPSAVPDK